MKKFKLFFERLIYKVLGIEGAIKKGEVVPGKKEKPKAKKEKVDKEQKKLLELYRILVRKIDRELADLEAKEITSGKQYPKLRALLEEQKEVYGNLFGAKIDGADQTEFVERLDEIKKQLVEITKK